MNDIVKKIADIVSDIAIILTAAKALEEKLLTQALPQSAAAEHVGALSKAIEETHDAAKAAHCELVEAVDATDAAIESHLAEDAERTEQA